MIWAFVPTAAIAVIIALIPAFGAIAPFSWFIGAGLAGALYWVLMPRPSSEATPKGAEAR